MNRRFLYILATSTGGKAVFISEYSRDDQAHELHEKSHFRRFKGDWKYLDGKS